MYNAPQDFDKILGRVNMRLYFGYNTAVLTVGDNCCIVTNMFQTKIFCLFLRVLVTLAVTRSSRFLVFL